MPGNKDYRANAIENLLNVKVEANDNASETQHIVEKLFVRLECIFGSLLEF